MDVITALSGAYYFSDEAEKLPSITTSLMDGGEVSMSEEEEDDEDEDEDEDLYRPESSDSSTSDSDTDATPLEGIFTSFKCN